jgi:hypothetical protein
MGRGWVAGPKVKKKNFWIKNWILNLPRLGKFVEGDLGGILTWGFFLNSSRLLKDFRKKCNMPCHAMHPIQDLFLKESFGDRKYLGTYLNTKKSIQFKINEFFFGNFKFLARKMVHIPEWEFRDVTQDVHSDGNFALTPSHQSPSLLPIAPPCSFFFQKKTDTEKITTIAS